MTIVTYRNVDCSECGRTHPELVFEVPDGPDAEGRAWHELLRSHSPEGYADVTVKEA